MSKENFKDFARLHPELANQVVNNKVTWQKLYELYDIYGENSSVWNPYFQASKDITKDTTINDIVTTIKGVDLETVQNGIHSMQKAIALLQDIGIGKGKDVAQSTYEPRPMYKYFED